ncbi:MAG: EVE domain-containing protein [Candidatus Nitrosoglobus sp.]
MDIRSLFDLPTPVSLKTIKTHPKLAQMSLATFNRLSIQPVTVRESD